MAIVNLMGEPILGGIFTKSKEKAIFESRVTATQTLAKAITEFGTKLKSYVGASAIGFYPFRANLRMRDAGRESPPCSALCGMGGGHNKISCDSHAIIRIGLVLSAHSPLRC